MASQVFKLTRNSCVRAPRMCQVMFNCSQSCKRKASIEVYHPSRAFGLISHKGSASFAPQCAETTLQREDSFAPRRCQVNESTHAGDFGDFSPLCAKCLKSTTTHDCLEDPSKTKKKFAACIKTNARFKPHQKRTNQNFFFPKRTDREHESFR